MHLFSEYAIFSHKPNKQFYDFDEVREEIVSQTERETGTGVCVTDKPINLKIYSPNVVNLTLIDLPGITRNPVGDQPRNIEEILRNMVVRYIREPSCIIMAVTAANTDLALSDAIQMAKEYDPTGERTIGVITKVDIMDRGTDASEIFDGQVIPLKLGYVGVINRSQSDINSRKDMHKQWEDESRFFRTYYPERANRMGTQFLRNRLNELLVNHISQSLPEIIQKVTTYRGQVSSQLAEIKSVNDGLSDVNASAVQIFINFTQQLKTTIFGHGSSSAEEETELTGGARIMDIFTRDFASSLQAVDVSECVTVRDIRTAIVNNRGIHGGLFAPEQALEHLILACLEHFEKPCYLCVEQVKNEFQTVISAVNMPEFQYFPLLREAVIRETLQLLDERAAITKEMIHVLLEMEQAYVNTAHPALSQENIKKLQGNAIATARARLLQKTHPNDPPEFQEPVVQGWMYLRREHGKFDHVYGLLKQRTLFYNVTATIDRADPGLKELFLEGATAAVVRNNPSLGEFEFQITLPSQESVFVRVDSEAVETNWVAWVNVAGSEEVWRETLTQLVREARGETEEEEKAREEEEARQKRENAVPSSVYHRSKVGVLQESSEWEEYNNNEQVMIEYLSRLVDSYLDTVKKNILDSMPKVGERGRCDYDNIIYNIL